MLSVIVTRKPLCWCHYGECHYAECNYGQCFYTECQYA